jgi:histidine triad (HIT) family protein
MMRFLEAVMFNYAPVDYRCPFCALAAGISDEQLHSRQQDIVLQNESVLAFIASHWHQNNPGHVLVIPRAHYENIYDLPNEIGAKIFEVSKRIAMALKKAYDCEGVSTRQHNEPAGHQDVWHYHLHIFPRYADDQLYLRYGNGRLTMPAERLVYANKLRQALDQAV